MIKHRTTAWLGRLPGVPLDDAALIVGATLRLTRAVVTDDIGKWWVRGPILKRAEAYLADRQRQWTALGEDAEGKADPSIEAPPVWWQKYLDGLDCPFCVGFHLGWLVLLSYLIARKARLLGPWRFVTSALTLNYVTAHLGVRLGDVGDEES